MPQQQIDLAYLVRILQSAVQSTKAFTYQRILKNRSQDKRIYVLLLAVTGVVVALLVFSISGESDSTSSAEREEMSATVAAHGTTLEDEEIMPEEIVEAVPQVEEPAYLDGVALFDRRNDFMALGSGMGFLENTLFLGESEQQSVEDLQNRIATLKEKYNSEPSNAMWQNFYQSQYERGLAQAQSTDRGIERALNDTDTIDGSPALPDPYSCTTFSSTNGYSSTYVGTVNDKLRSSRQALYRLEYYLPKPKNSGIPMLTQADHYRINGPSVFCVPQDGSVNPAIAREAAAIERANNVKKRIPPYSESGTPQHEMLCRTLNDPGIPPPFGAKCVFNYEDTSKSGS